MRVRPAGLRRLAGPPGLDVEGVDLGPPATVLVHGDRPLGAGKEEVV